MLNSWLAHTSLAEHSAISEKYSPQPLRRQKLWQEVLTDAFPLKKGCRVQVQEFLDAHLTSAQ